MHPLVGTSSIVPLASRKNTISESAREPPNASARQMSTKGNGAWLASPGRRNGRRRVKSRPRHFVGATARLSRWSSLPLLHCNRIGQKAQTRKQPSWTRGWSGRAPYKIELRSLTDGVRHNSLTRAFQDAATGQVINNLQRSWLLALLGSKPNPKQMHHDACSRVQPPVSSRDKLPMPKC